MRHYSLDADGLCCRLTVVCPEPNHTKDELEIERSSVLLTKQLKAGEFGEMWEGIWNGTKPVTVNISKSRRMGMQEVRIMKKLQHEHIIQLYAVCTEGEPMYIVTELMKNGILQDYLQKGEGQHMKLPELIDVAAQVASGMAYLEECHYIHRNLGAHNVMVGEGNIVKIANFRMARVTINDDYIPELEEKLRIKWTAPEALLYDHFSIKSDVWSYGIFLWELITYGQAPYSGMNITETRTKVKQGYRMSQPPDCPDSLYQIMRDCWKENPEERPAFEYLKYHLLKHVWEIEWSSIQLKQRLGAGQFGEVWEGIWNGTTPVAVKTLETAEIKKMQDFLANLQLVKKLRHDKLIQLYGVCTEGERMYIVTELMKNGSLLDCLKSDEGRRLKLPRLIDIAAQVASGMVYLEAQDLIHRNLGARNILIGEGNIVKIAGFIMTCIVTDEDTTEQKKLLYAKWTAPEAFFYNRFSIKSDVWSYGIFLWELITYGQRPYPGIPNKEVPVAVEQGYRMPRPLRCPDSLYQIMRDCWKENPEERPTFEYLKYHMEDYFVPDEQVYATP